MPPGTPPDHGGGRARSKASRGPAPIYKRLPAGPHQLERHEVVGNQRARIHGAMVEAVARGGYEAANVRQVIALAGVSRRSFYELFANKQACFLATCGVMAARATRRLRSACRDAGVRREDRLAAALQTCETSLREDAKTASLLLWAIHAAGEQGVAQLCQASASWELMLGQCLRPSSSQPLPSAPILRGVSGGLQWALALSLRGQRTDTPGELSEQLLALTLPFCTRSSQEASTRLARRLRERVRELSVAAHRAGPSAPTSDPRSMLLDSALRLASEAEPAELSAARIADASGLPVERFFELFTNAEECREAALEGVISELLAVARDSGLAGDEWPWTVPHGCERLLDHLARRPVHVRALLLASFRAGDVALTRHIGAAHALGSLLSGAAGAPAEESVRADAAVGTLWQFARHQLATGRVRLLAALPEVLSFVLLAPALGAEDAAGLALGDQRRRRVRRSVK